MTLLRCCCCYECAFFFSLLFCFQWSVNRLGVCMHVVGVCYYLFPYISMSMCLDMSLLASFFFVKKKEATRIVVVVRLDDVSLHGITQLDAYKTNRQYQRFNCVASEKILPVAVQTHKKSRQRQWRRRRRRHRQPTTTLNEWSRIKLMLMTPLNDNKLCKEYFSLIYYCLISHVRRYRLY